MKMKTKYFFVLIAAFVMGTQVMNAQRQEQGKRPQGHRRMTLEQMTEMQANKIIGELGLDDNTAAKFTDVYKKYTSLPIPKNSSSRQSKRYSVLGTTPVRTSIVWTTTFPTAGVLP